jgi:hypothetical protein
MFDGAPSSQLGQQNTVSSKATVLSCIGADRGMSWVGEDVIYVKPCSPSTPIAKNPFAKCAHPKTAVLTKSGKNPGAVHFRCLPCNEFCGYATEIATEKPSEVSAWRAGQVIALDDSCDTVRSTPKRKKARKHESYVEHSASEASDGYSSGQSRESPRSRSPDRRRHDKRRRHIKYDKH